jgi:hypothetical protein
MEPEYESPVNCEHVILIPVIATILATVAYYTVKDVPY